MKIIDFIFFTQADVPDSFYDLSSKELIGFQKSLQDATKSLVERPFVSAKAKIKNDQHFRDNADLKLVFPDQVQVRMNFPSNIPSKRQL